MSPIFNTEATVDTVYKFMPNSTEIVAVRRLITKYMYGYSEAKVDEK